MKSAARDLAKYAIARGYSVTVDDGEYDGQPPVHKSRSITAIMAEVHEVDSTAMIFTKDGEKAESAYIVLGNNPDEEVADFSCDGMVEEWFDQFLSE